MASNRRSNVTPEPRSVEEALDNVQKGIAEPHRANNRYEYRRTLAALALLRSEIERLQGIEKAARTLTRAGGPTRGRGFVVAQKFADALLAALARPDRQEEGE